MVSSLAEVFVLLVNVPLLYITDNGSWLSNVLGLAVVTAEGTVLFMLWASGDEDVEVCGKTLAPPTALAEFGKSQRGDLLPLRKSPVVMAHVITFVACAVPTFWIIIFGDGTCQRPEVIFQSRNCTCTVLLKLIAH